MEIFNDSINLLSKLHVCKRHCSGHVTTYLEDSAIGVLSSTEKDSTGYIPGSGGLGEGVVVNGFLPRISQFIYSVQLTII